MTYIVGGTVIQSLTPFESLPVRRNERPNTRGKRRLQVTMGLPFDNTIEVTYCSSQVERGATSEFVANQSLRYLDGFLDSTPIEHRPLYHSCTTRDRMSLKF
jgi:hypothetical protein